MDDGEERQGLPVNFGESRQIEAGGTATNSETMSRHQWQPTTTKKGPPWAQANSQPRGFTTSGSAGKNNVQSKFQRILRIAPCPISDQACAIQNFSFGYVMTQMSPRGGVQKHGRKMLVALMAEFVYLDGEPGLRRTNRPQNPQPSTKTTRTQGAEPH